MIEEKKLVWLDDINIKCEMCGTYFREGVRIQSKLFSNEPTYNLCEACYINKRKWIYQKITSIVLSAK